MSNDIGILTERPFISPRLHASRTWPAQELKISKTGAEKKKRNKKLYRCLRCLLGFSSLSLCFCLHCHSTRTGRKYHKSKSGQRHLRKKIWVSWWHCQSIKSLSLSTPLVRMKRSNGGHSAVYMWLLRVSAVMVSGFLKALGTSWVVESDDGGVPGGSVVPDDTEQSTSSGGGDSWMEPSAASLFPACFERIFCLMRVWEKALFWGRGWLEYSTAVDRIACVISSLEVYGKQMLRI